MKKQLILEESDLLEYCKSQDLADVTIESFKINPREVLNAGIVTFTNHQGTRILKNRYGART